VVVVVVSENEEEEEEEKIIPQTTKEVITTEENTTTITTNSSTINNSKAYFNFVNSINSPATRKTYEFAIKKYMQYYGLQAIDELLLLATNNKETIPIIIEDKIINWLVALRETITYHTRHTYMSAILTFYEINDITLRRRRIAKFLGQESTRNTKDRAYTAEEIRKMLEHADIRSKALVLLLASSGMRIGAVSDLRLRHLTKVPEPYNLYKITVYENTREEYNAYSSPECAAAIDAYIAYRQEKGEKITPDAPLIRESFDKLIKDTSGEFFGTTKKAAETLAIRSIGSILSNLLVKAGIVKIRSRAELQQQQKICSKHHNSSNGSERKAVHRAHGLRKYLLTALAEADVDPQYRKMLLGQDIGIDKSYLKPSDQQLLQKYVRVIDSITINNEHRLQRKVVELTQKQDDIELMKSEQQRKDLELREQMQQQQQQQYKRMIEEFQERDRKEKEELRREVLGYFKAIRILVDLPAQEEAATTAMKKSNKAYYLKAEDTETKETLKKAQTRAAEQLRKDTLERNSHRLRSINNRIQ
jgi:integrase